MAKYSFDAIEIFSDNGNGIPVSYTDAATGFVSGIFRARTGRYTITVAAGDSTVTSWATAILSEGGVSGGVSGDFETTPKISTTSGFGFSLINVSDLIGTLQTNGIYLNNCKTKHYYVVSDDGSEWDFHLIQTGVIDRISYDEGILNIQCVPYFKSFLSKIGRGKVDSTRFPNSPEDSRDKSLPMVYGRSAYSPMVAVVSDTGMVPLNIIGSNTYYSTACTAYEINVGGQLLHSLTLKSTGTDYVENDPRIVGKYVNIVHGGVSQYRPITACWSDASGELEVAFTEELDTSTAFLGWTYGSLSNAIWYATITGYNAVVISANHEISEILSGSNGSPGAFVFDSDRKEYSSISEIVETSSTDNIESTNLPGLSVVKTSETPSGEITTYRPIVPEEIELVSGSTYNVTLVSGTVSTDLNDVDASTGVTWTKASNVIGAVVLNMRLPRDFKTPNAEKFYLLLDIIESSTYAATRSLTIDILAYDIFGRSVTVGSYVYGRLVSTTSANHFLLPRSYYGEKPTTSYSDYRFHYVKDGLDISHVFELSNPGLLYETITFSCTLDAVGGGGFTDTFRIVEAGIVYKASASFSNETIFSHQVGALFETTWNGRKTATDPVLLAGDVIEKIVRDHDYDVPPWEASTAYIVGDKVRTPADNKHIYLCTVAGTSGSSAPTWPTTSWGTITDNTATWTEVGTFPIDEDAFDDINSGDRSWAYTGRTVTKETQTSQEIEAICKDFFIGIRPNKNGELSPIAFLEQTTPIAEFTNANSFDYGPVEPTDQSQVFTEIDLLYGYDNGSGTFNARLFVTNTDKPAFPSSLEPLDVGTSLGSFTITRTMPSPGFYYYSIECASPHGLSDGDYVYLTGNADGYDFTPRQIIWIDSYIFNVGDLSGTAATSTSGTLLVTSSSALKWKTYVGGVDNYSEASSLWERYRQNFLVLKTRNSAPKEISECYWIIDNNLTDSAGNYLWPDIASSTVRPAYEYALRVSNWSSAIKARFQFSVDVKPENIALLAYDLISFSDPILTDGIQYGYLEEKKYFPRKDGSVNEHFRITMLAIPDYTADLPDRIIDTADVSDRILDVADSTNRILDVPQ